MKLCKKKMAILATVCALMLVMVFVLCSFTLPDYSDSYSDAYIFSSFSTSDLDHIYSIINLQYSLGQFNSLVPIGIFRGANYGLVVLFILPTYSYTFSLTGLSAIWTLSNSNSTFVKIAFNSQGFFIYSTAESTLTISSNTCLAYKTSVDQPFIKNSSFPFSGTSVNPVLSSCYNYWFEFYSNVTGLNDRYNDGYNDGYTDGYLTGNADGYRNGYDEGVDYGYNVGYPAGYDSGLADGYETGFADGLETGYRNGYYQGDIDGYESGYDEGYSEGYSDGYETAERETVIEYVEPVELDIPHIFDGMKNGVLGIFQFVNWDIFGINILGVLLSITIAAILVFVFKRLRV